MTGGIALFITKTRIVHSTTCTCAFQKLAAIGLTSKTLYMKKEDMRYSTVYRYSIRSAQCSTAKTHCQVGIVLMYIMQLRVA